MVKYENPTGAPVDRRIPGPRTAQRREAYRLRKALLDSGRTQNLTVLLCQAGTEASAQRRARLVKGGDGDTPPMDSDRRERAYLANNAYRGLTARQLRQLIRRDGEVDRTTHHAEAAAEFGWTTPPKGRPTPKRPMISAKGVQA